MRAGAVPLTILTSPLAGADIAKGILCAFDEYLADEFGREIADEAWLDVRDGVQGFGDDISDVFTDLGDDISDVFTPAKSEPLPSQSDIDDWMNQGGPFGPNFRY